MSKTTGATDVVFVKVESTRGTWAAPAGTDVCRVIGDVDLSQGRVTAESLERVDSLSLTDLLELRYTAGTFSLPVYLKRTGTNTTGVPSLQTLLKNAMGRETVGGSDITYALYRNTDPLLNFSMVHRKGGMTFDCTGCFVTDLSIPFQATADEAAIGRATFAGQFYKMLWAGQTTITAQCSTPFTTVKVATTDLAPYDGTSSAAVRVAGKFCVGATVELVGVNTPPATGSVITAINPGTGDITVSPAIAGGGGPYAIGTVLRGWAPTESETGTEISGHKGVMVYDAQNFTALLSGTVHLTIPRRALVEEKNGQDFATDDCFEGKRKVTVEGIRAYFDPVGTPKQDLFYALSDRLTKKAITIDIGNAQGYIYQFSMGNVICQQPKLSGSGIVELEMTQAAMASASLDDELTIVSK